MSDKILTISEITSQIKFTLEEKYDDLVLVGEISNFKAHVSGHWYFTLKDSTAQISAAMWRGVNNYVYFTPQDGMKVIVTGKISVYAPRGSYQIDVRSMKPAGVGELQAAFEKLKQKLASEGLFDEKYKKGIPQLPAKIGIVTSRDGAAFQDMKSIAQRRFPLTEFVLASCKVQGDGAANEIAQAINDLNKFDDIDLIIIGRGGGSLEDLWAFNEEVVARAIFKSEIPIISAVGHEIDFTISDFVADLRAPTPSAAIELATPDMQNLIDWLSNLSNNFYQILVDKLSDNFSNLRQLIFSYGFRRPLDNLNTKSQQLDNMIYRIENNCNSKLKFHKSSLELISARLESHNIEKVLQKGFTLIQQNEKFVKRKETLDPNSIIKIKFIDGDVIING